MPSDKEKVMINVPPELVREGIPYTDRSTGEHRTFNVVTLPEGCELSGEDLSGWEFSPLFVDPSDFREGWRKIPLLAEREVRLSRTVMEDGRPKRDERGKRVKEERRVDPVALADAVACALGIEPATEGW